MKDKKQLRRLTETAMMLALLITFQALTKPYGQLLTGSLVNALLAITVLMVGLPGGLAVAIVSPILAYFLKIAPQVLTVPAIMVGNSVYVVLLYLMSDRQGKKLGRQLLAWLVAAGAKFAALYAIVVWLICGVLSERLLDSGVMKPAMLKALPATFSWPQLITALIGGGVALAMVPLLKKALYRS